jgi:hypothetical protein
LVVIHGTDEHANPDKAVVWTEITHVYTGYSKISRVVIPGPGTAPQDFGGRVTYIKRYQYNAMLGIAAEMDMDGVHEGDHQVTVETTEPDAPSYPSRAAAPPARPQPRQVVPTRADPETENIPFVGLDGKTTRLRMERENDVAPIEKWRSAWDQTLRSPNLTASGLGKWVKDNQSGLHHVETLHPDVHRAAMNDARSKHKELASAAGGSR